MCFIYTIKLHNINLNIPTNANTLQPVAGSADMGSVRNRQALTKIDILLLHLFNTDVHKTAKG